MNSHNTFIVLNPLRQLPRPQLRAKRSRGPAWSGTPKSISEMEAEGDVTHKYVPRGPMCLDYGPWYNLCPSLTGIMQKIQYTDLLITCMTL